jgi:cholesterol oxidase
LTIANRLEEENSSLTPNENGSNLEKICILERGQWWISPEIPIDEKGVLDQKPTIHQFLRENNMPHDFFPYDNLKGFLKILGNSRLVDNVKGLYDYRLMQNVHIISGSGVGGGSLVYFNVTERPDVQVYKDWPTEKDNHASLLRYFSTAERFLGINSITTTTSLGRYKLPKSRVFQEAARSINSKFNNILNEKNNAGDINLDAKLSITEISNDSFVVENDDLIHPTLEEARKYSNQTNICQRHGRCGLGCLPDARHSMDKKIFEAINNGKPIHVFPLCEVISIEETLDDHDYRYSINFKDHRNGKNSQSKRMMAKKIILSAGSLGSTEILLRSNKLKLSNKLGTNFSTNGDIFGIINPTKEIVDASRGPTITSIARFIDTSNSDAPKFYSIEDIGIPKMFAGVFETISNFMVLKDKHFPERIYKKLLALIKDLVTSYKIKNQLSGLFEKHNIESSDSLVNKLSEMLTTMEKYKSDKKKSLPPEESVNNILVLFGMGQDNEIPGQLFIDEYNSLSSKYDLDQPIYEKMIKTMRLFADRIGVNGEDGIVIPLWNDRNRIQISAHPLGGCPMGEDATAGVVNSKGQLFKGTNGNDTYDGFYVVDSSIIPSPLGVNPSLTVAALAFRIAETMVDDEKYWPE